MPFISGIIALPLRLAMLPDPPKQVSIEKRINEYDANRTQASTLHLTIAPHKRRSNRENGEFSPEKKRRYNKT